MLTNKVIKRVEVDKGEHWIEVRMPSHFMFLEMGGNYGLEEQHRFLSQCITGWSYEAELTPDNIRELDTPTVNALTEALHGVEPQADRKNASRRSTKP